MTGRAPSVALVSAKGSPGVTTAALLLAAVWPGGATLLEADPAGGDLRTLFLDAAGQPLRADQGVVSLLTAQAGNHGDRTYAGTNRGADLGATLGPNEAGSLGQHSQLLPGGLPVVLGPSNASQVEALRPQWPLLAAAVAHSSGSSVVVDAGRLSDPSSLALTLPLLRTSSVTLVVARATVTSLSHARDLLGLLTQVDIPSELLLIGAERDTADVPEALGLAADRMHVLPDDPDSAAALTGPWNRKLDRSRLLAAARHVAGSLQQRLTLAGANEQANDPADKPATPEVPAEQLVDVTGADAVRA